MSECVFCKDSTGKGAWKRLQNFRSDAMNPNADPTDEEGIDFFLYRKTFFIFDVCEGYLGDSMEIPFNYCPFCGRQL